MTNTTAVNIFIKEKSPKAKSFTGKFVRSNIFHSQISAMLVKDTDFVVVCDATSKTSMYNISIYKSNFNVTLMKLGKSLSQYTWYGHDDAIFGKCTNECIKRWVIR